MNLIRANCELLQQGIDILERHDDTTFVAVDPASYGSGIGSHFRHVLDHYKSFLAGLDSGLIDYDDRRRETRAERERELMLSCISDTRDALSKARVEIGDPVKVRVSASTDEDELRSSSSFGRELQFLVSHTVHHYALIAIASRMMGIMPSDDFGVAPSTLKYLKIAHS